MSDKLNQARKARDEEYPPIRWLKQEGDEAYGTVVGLTLLPDFSFGRNHGLTLEKEDGSRECIALGVVKHDDRGEPQVPVLLRKLRKMAPKPGDFVYIHRGEMVEGGRGSYPRWTVNNGEESAAQVDWSSVPVDEGNEDEDAPATDLPADEPPDESHGDDLDDLPFD